eukprot:9140592-Prorocentrum_lima.AAC.1
MRSSLPDYVVANCYVRLLSTLASTLTIARCSRHTNTRQSLCLATCVATLGVASLQTWKVSAQRK